MRKVRHPVAMRNRLRHTPVREVVLLSIPYEPI